MKHNKSKLVIYSLQGCPYSMAAVDFLKKKNIEYELVNVTQSTKSECKMNNRMNTFPQIFIIKSGIKFKIGGYDDMMILYNKVNKDHSLDQNVNNLKKILKGSRKDILRFLNIFFSKNLGNK